MQRQTDVNPPLGIFGIHDTLEHIASKNHTYYLPLFKQREYSLIFRKAACECNAELIKLLLKCSALIDLDLNATSSNGNTALDWAFESSDNPGHRTVVVTLLMDAGAKTGNELRGVNESSDEALSDELTDGVDIEEDVLILPCSML